jgi:cation transport ATPase
MIANRAGTDIAVEAADYVLMRSDLEGVLTALDLSKKTFRRIYYNYGWAFVYNVLMVPLAAGVLYPPLRFQLPPWVSHACCYRKKSGFRAVGGCSSVWLLRMVLAAYIHPCDSLLIEALATLQALALQ